MVLVGTKKILLADGVRHDEPKPGQIVVIVIFHLCCLFDSFKFHGLAQH